jgi:hypothetical protein
VAGYWGVVLLFQQCHVSLVFQVRDSGGVFVPFKNKQFFPASQTGLGQGRPSSVEGHTDISWFYIQWLQIWVCIWEYWFQE